MPNIGLAFPISGFNDQEVELRLSLVRPMLPDGFTVGAIRGADSPKWLDSEGDFADAIAAACAFFAATDASTWDVILASGALDPGLPEVRKVCPVPLIGPGEAALFAASVVGRPLSVVTVDEHAVKAVVPFLEQTATKPPIVSTLSLGVPVREMVQDRARGVEAVLRTCRTAVERDGAQAIFLGSMTLGTLGVVEAVRDQLGVPVFDPLRIAVAQAVQCGYALAGGAR
jgi:allantoin racemase